MKSTQASTYRSLQSQVNKMGTKLMELRNTAATGKRVNKPSDDPTVIKSIMHTRSLMRSNERFVTTMALSMDKMSTVEGQMSHMENILASAKEVAIGSINAALDTPDRNILADQVANLRDEMMTVANAQIDGKYIFAGYEEKTKPFTYDPAIDPALYDPAVPATWPSVLYNGDGNTGTVEIAPGEYLDIAINGAALFQGDSNFDGAVDAGDSDIFTSLTMLEAAIRNGDTNTINAQIDELDNGADQGRRLRGKLGNNARRIENSSKNIEDSQIDLQEILSRYEDADIIEIIGQITQQEEAFKAALSITARTNELSILNYL